MLQVDPIDLGRQVRRERGGRGPGPDVRSARPAELGTSPVEMPRSPASRVKAVMRSPIQADPPGKRQRTLSTSPAPHDASARSARMPRVAGASACSQAAARASHRSAVGRADQAAAVEVVDQARSVRATSVARSARDR
ncbi:hypothetical protein BC477_03695 [Clavibacter michiganensis subsp. michiganensis]|uniref:Uncharacterized protein n=1 Tax=Clavibacter michiganensis subsp. michiganensis TaxID=33013 RepID=A0A251XJW5_CLAMM|nr:hypothetical protein BC477_03695 [Clavibacter michiganensis subsp. michiganensis]OUE03815.1 hypothetical protein CMMCAS07_02630 [Clavibacter michiganensis subsp. michiganensis]